jgi:hypothetical protein
VKLLIEEDKNTGKCQKEKEKKSGFAPDARSIVATMTPIVPRWEQT